MFRTILVLLSGILLCGNSLLGQIETYPWPEESELIDNRHYEIRVRELDTVTGKPGFWIPLKSFYSFQRSYPEHWKCGDDAGTDFMVDRSLTFTSFAFTGSIEVEVTQKLSPQKAVSVEIAPGAFGFTPNFFDGKTVRFIMNRPEYLSINFSFGESDLSINRDDNRAGGSDIRHGCLVLAEFPEKELGAYPLPGPEDPGVQIWSDSADLATILEADLIYFPPGEHFLRDHKDRWERNSSWEPEEAAGNWVTTEAEYRNARLYRGRLNLGKDNQRVYLAPGAIVYGGFHSAGKDGNWLYGRGIVTGRRHLMHEIVVPATGYIAETDKYKLVTKTKEAFCHFGEDAVYDGIIFLEAWHHTCPSARNTTIHRTKIIGWCSNNDGIRPGDGSLVDRIFIKTSDDYDYFRGPHTVRNAVVWPMVNGAVGQLGWNDLGTGYATYENLHVIHAEWHVKSLSEKSNIGIICGGKANAGIKLQKNILENCHIEDRTNFLVAVALEGQGTGYLKDFTIRNVSTEYPFQNPAGIPVKQELRGTDNTWCENWTFSNVFIDGVLLTWDNYKTYFNLNLAGINGINSDDHAKARNIAFNFSGPIHQISCDHSGNGHIRPRGTDGIVQVAEGMDQSIFIQPDEGNRIRSIAVDGILRYEHGNTELNDRRQAWVFKEVSGDHSISVEFEEGADYFDLTRPATNSLPGNYSSNIRVFPVPATDYFTLQLMEPSPSSVKLYTSTGALVMQKHTLREQLLLPAWKLPDGIYFLEVTNRENRFRQSLIIQR